MVVIRPLSLAFLMLALLAPASASGEPTTRIIVKREPGLTSAEQRDIRADVGATLVERLSVPRMEVIEVPRSKAASALRELRRDPDVADLQLDGTVQAFTTDPALDELWGFRNFGQPVHRFDDAGNLEYYPALSGADMKVRDAWDANVAPGLGDGHTVAVVDSGVKATHEDFQPVDPSEPHRFLAGYDWVDEDANADDPRGHGTHVAGTIAATKDNEFGAAGVAPNARILPLRVLNAEGKGATSDIIDAFHFAGEQGIRVVNASIGATGDQSLMRQAIEAEPDTLFIAAAGNGGVDVDEASHRTYPCSFDLENVLCVGASDARDEKPAWSNFGAQSVDVYAPGEGILSTGPSDTGYSWSSGTSTAAPYIAGLAALLLSRDPLLTPAELKTAIVSEADTDPLLGPTGFSGRRANAVEALTYVPANGDGDEWPDAGDNCPDVFSPGTTQIAADECDAARAESDADQDGVLDTEDGCPYEAASPTVPGGCPGVAPDSNSDGIPDIFDGDGDGVRNALDNCPATATTNTLDSDRDGLGNACDTTPRGPDVDRDGKPALDDRCPTVYARTANGCPVPPPPDPDRDNDGRLNAADACPLEPALSLDGCPLPAVTALSAKSRKRRATISVRTSRAATVKITVQRKRGRRWVRVTLERLATSANRARLRTKRLRRGRYRAVVVLSSSAGRAHAETVRFPVR